MRHPHVQLRPLAPGRVVRAGLAALLLLTVALSGCRRSARPEEPAAVVQHFVELMQRVHGDDTPVAREAFELLDEASRKNLEERAARAGAVSGERVAPEQMIAPSRFVLRFEPRNYEAEVQGELAVVQVSGANQGEHAQVHCRNENGAWKVVLQLPPLSPVRKRAERDELEE